MSNAPDDRKRLLYALLKYAEESETFNPHCQRSEIAARLGWDERRLNIAQKALGDRYCRYVGQQDADARYKISLSECLALRDEWERQETAAQRHRQMVYVGVACALLGAVLATALQYLFGLT